MQNFQNGRVKSPRKFQKNAIFLKKNMKKHKKNAKKSLK